MMIRISTWLAAGFGLLALPNLALASDLVAANHCADCHAESGVSEDPDVPILAGQSVFIIADALYAFAERERPCREGVLADGSPVDHCALVEELSEAQQEAIGEHYAALAYAPQSQSFDSALAESGAKVHNDRCERCHTEGGSVSEDDAGLLAGQWSPYLRRTLTDYMSEDRVMPEKMAEKMEGLSADDIEALVHFYAQQGSQ